MAAHEADVLVAAVGWVCSTVAIVSAAVTCFVAGPASTRSDLFAGPCPRQVIHHIAALRAPPGMAVLYGVLGGECAAAACEPYTAEWWGKAPPSTAASRGARATTSTCCASRELADLLLSCMQCARLVSERRVCSLTNATHAVHQCAPFASSPCGGTGMRRHASAAACWRAGPSCGPPLRRPLAAGGGASAGGWLKVAPPLSAYVLPMHTDCGACVSMHRRHLTCIAGGLETPAVGTLLPAGLAARSPPCCLPPSALAAASL